MANKATDSRAAEEIVAALSTPGRQARLRRWTLEFLDLLGDFPDPDEPTTIHRAQQSRRRQTSLPEQRQHDQDGARRHQAARYGR